MASSYTDLYVDTDIGSAGDGTSWAKAKASLLDAINLLDGNTADVTIHCKASSGTADTTIAFWGADHMDATHRLTITSDAGDRAAGKWDTSKYRLVPVMVGNSAESMLLMTPNTTLDHLQLGIDDDDTYSDVMVLRIMVDGAGTINISNCLFLGDYATNGNYGIHLVDYGFSGTLNVWNCVFSGFKVGDSTLGGMILSDDEATTNVYSCTFGRNGFGIRRVAGTVVAKNCYADCSAGWSGYAYYGTITKTTCASSDNSGSAGLQSIALSTTADSTHAGFTNITAGTEDYHIKTGSPLLTTGTNTSGEGSPLNFNTDIDGDSRGTSWDIGADQVTVAVVASIITKVMYHYRMLRV